MRLRALIEEAEKKLENQGCLPDTIRDLVAPLYELSDPSGGGRHPTDGLALFRAPGVFRYHAVPFAVPEVVTVADRFYLAPLLRVSGSRQSFYLLTFGQSGASLLQATTGGVLEIRDVPFPASPLAPGDERELRRNGHHDRSVRGRFALFNRKHTRDHRKQALLGWFRGIDDVLRSKLEPSCPPVVLVAVQYLCPMFRHISRYRNLVEGEIHGSPDGFAPDELWQRGWEVAATYFQAAQQGIADEYLRLWHTPRASNDIRDIEAAARQGRIQTLFVGVRSPEDMRPVAKNGSGQSEPHAETRDLLELATLNTFMMGGTVYAVPPEQVPGRASAAAVFRY
jgi:hypothetical protein